MNAKTILPLALLGALLAAGCTAPQEAGDTTTTDNTSVACPSDLNENTNASANETNETNETYESNSTYGATQDDGAGDECADMQAPTPGTTTGNETNETNTTP